MRLTLGHDDVGVVEEAVDRSCGDALREDRVEPRRVKVRSQNARAFLVCGVDQAIQGLGLVGAGWSESVKRLWDEDTRAGRGLHVVLLGSAPLLVEQGLSESLAGRFEVIRSASRTIRAKSVRRSVSFPDTRSTYSRAAGTRPWRSAK
jgi:hypothetical protein